MIFNKPLELIKDKKRTLRANQECSVNKKKKILQVFPIKEKLFQTLQLSESSSWILLHKLCNLKYLDFTF